MNIVTIRVRRLFLLIVPYRNVLNPPLLIVPCRSPVQNSVHLIFLSDAEIRSHTQISKWERKMIACEWEEPSDKQNGRIIVSHTASQSPLWWCGSWKLAYWWQIPKIKTFFRFVIKDTWASTELTLITDDALWLLSHTRLSWQIMLWSESLVRCLGLLIIQLMILGNKESIQNSFTLCK